MSWSITDLPFGFNEHCPLRAHSIVEGDIARLEIRECNGAPIASIEMDRGTGELIVINRMTAERIP